MLKQSFVPGQLAGALSLLCVACAPVWEVQPSEEVMDDSHAAAEAATHEENHAEEPVAEPLPEFPDTPVGRMNAAYAEIMLREEHKDMDVSLRHVLLTFDGVASEYYINPRKKAEAEQLATGYFERINAGESIVDLIPLSDDKYFPTHTVSAASRYELAKGFGDILWRLQPGEVAPLPYEPVLSPYGWHIIMRTR